MVCSLVLRLHHLPTGLHLAASAIYIGHLIPEGI